jgi:predicted acylesterase/phospholipase RssA
VSAARLADEGTRLKFSALNLETGRTDTFSYPGCDVPLTDALMSAVALPGVTPPGMIRGHQYVEGTVVRGFILTDVLQEPVDEIYAIGAAASQPHRFEAGTRFDTWRAVMQRAMQLNQSHDIWHELNLARTRLRGRRARAEVHRALPGSLSRLVPDAEVAERLRARLAMIYPSHDAPVEPVLHVLTPSRDLDFPLWRFRRRDIVGAIDLGFADAQRDLAAPSVEGVR